ncbi:uncharacterized protein LOC134801016 [Cydia splendana]|uniref:uncharacterized protein LOC134801016 n=1 Tax=Cydia splendana TaxID=1100963 RepID=UPI0028F4BB24
MKMHKERFDKRICWIIGNIMFLTVFCVTMLVLPSTGQSQPNRYNVIIHDYTLDGQMYDSCTQRNYTDYCNRTDCDHGTHVMCMYFKSRTIMGPQCEQGKMFRMDQNLQDIVVTEIENMRKEAANGTALDRNGGLLPKAEGYGPRLLWDHDLAFFAQIWANQCQHNLDFCRSTRNFSNPEQFVGIDTFSNPEWLSTNTSRPEIVSSCLTEEKVTAAIKSIMNLLKEVGRLNTTSDMIVHYNGRRNAYLNMLYQNVTHIGCAMSHYFGYKQLTDPLLPRKHDVFVLQLVCNLSHKLVAGDRVYNTSEPVTTTTPSTTTSSTTTTRRTPTSTSKSGAGNSGENIPGLRNRGRGPGVVIMPIITVEDSPPDLIQQRNFAQRKSSRVSQSNYNNFGTDNQQTKIAPYSRKTSIFARAPIFNLSPGNGDSTSNLNLEDKVLLKKQFKSLLDQVPRTEVPRLRELLKQIIKKHKSEENHTPRLGPVEIDTGAYTRDLVNGETDEDILRLTNSKLKEITHGSRLVGSDVANYPSNKDTVIIQDANTAFDTQSEFEIPIIRKQKPIVHAKKEKPNNSDKDQTLIRGHSIARKQGSSLANTDLAFINHIQAEPSQMKSNFRNNAGRQNIYDAGNKMNDHTQTASDVTTLKRRLYLENEVSKLKRKLQNLRQYIRKNDVDENARIRPVVTSQSGQRSTKFDEGKNFYMPDRAHPLHEY